MIIGTGIDIIEVSRVERAMARWGDAFLHHLFSEDEIAYARSNKYPQQHFAARFAAKEAILKAIGDIDHITWKDMEIRKHPNGQPYCVFKQGDFPYKILISISHTKNYAVANAIVTSE